MIVLPPEASLFAFAMGIIGWYGLVGNGVQLIYSDVKAAKSFDRDVRGLKEGLLRQQRRIEVWKMQWLVSEHAPDSMFVEFWGDAQYRGIKETLSDMAFNCNEAEKNLKTFMKLDEKKWKAMKRCQKRIYFIGLKGEYLRKLMNYIENAVDGLQDAAKNGWQRSSRSYMRKPDIDFKAVYHAGVGHLIVPIAMRTKKDADALHGSCRSAHESNKIELDLDIFNNTNPVLPAPSGSITSSIAVSRELGAAAVAKAAKNGLPVWKLLVQNSRTGNTDSVRMQVQRVEVRSSEWVIFPVSVALSHIIDKADKSHFEDSDICFCNTIAEDSKRSSLEPLKSLRNLFSGNEHPSFTNEDMLGKISKFRVAFELAQACLLLLRTSWFPKICSCHIRCALCYPASTELTYNFGLQMGSNDHEAPRWGNEAMGDCWSIDNYNWNSLTRPLRHLGLLLIEIVIGSPILRIASDVSGAVESISFVQGDPSRLSDRSEKLEGMLDRVRKVFSGRDAAASAVRYCLTNVYPDAPTDDDMKKLLADYYLDVVAPYELLCQRS